VELPPSALCDVVRLRKPPTGPTTGTPTVPVIDPVPPGVSAPVAGLLLTSNPTGGIIVTPPTWTPGNVWSAVSVAISGLLAVVEVV
jgi:hypothetical protein